MLGKLSVGFQGEPGAFSEEAARALLGDIDARGFATFDDLVAAVDANDVTYGLLPVENTIYGSIARSYDLLWSRRRIRIVDETTHRISQCLVGLTNATIAGVGRVASHPVAIEQCRRFLASLQKAKVAVVEDTAAAVRMVIEHGDPAQAAIASASAAKRYGGTVLASDIQDDADNFTRFFLIQRDGTPRRNSGQACMALILPHETGSLNKALQTFAEAGCNLRSLVARPDRKSAFNYIFYIEFQCDGKTTPLDMLHSLGNSAELLGVY